MDNERFLGLSHRPIIGRYLSMYVKANYSLIICEMEVYGKHMVSYTNTPYDKNINL